MKSIIMSIRVNNESYCLLFERKSNVILIIIIIVYVRFEIELWGYLTHEQYIQNSNSGHEL